MKVALFLVTTLFCSNLFAFSIKEKIDSFREGLRPYAEKVVGQDFAVLISGEKKDEIVMPAIPKLEGDATSTKNFGNNVADNKKEKVKIDPEIAQKYDYMFLIELYQEVRGEKPTEAILSQWMNNLSQGGSREAVYRALVLDQTYGGLENYPKPMNDATVAFAMKYLEKFAGVTLKKETFQQLNIYSMKREAVERFLSVFDALLIKNENEAYNWYALFSAELATEYPTFFKSKIRLNQNPKDHKQWAISIPTQHIRSEIMVKVHATFNALDNPPKKD